MDGLKEEWTVGPLEKDQPADKWKNAAGLDLFEKEKNKTEMLFSWDLYST